MSAGIAAPLLPLLLLAAGPAPGAASSAGELAPRSPLASNAQPPANSAEELAGAPGADALLARVDAAANRGRDATLTLTLKSTDARGETVERELKVWQKGEDRRMLKVLAPARLRGVGLLTPRSGELLLYLPAFGRVRQVVGPDRDDRFLGTDFSFDDLTRTRFAADYRAALEREEEQDRVLRLTPMQPGQAKHAALLLWVRRADDLYRRVDFLDAAGQVTRRITLDDFRAAGPRTIAHRIVVEDLAGKRQSEALITSARFDQGLEDDLFSRRYLERAP